MKQKTHGRSQPLRAWPDLDTIRLNANLLALFKFADSDTVLEDVYPLFSAFIKENEFKELYEYSTQEPFNALVIDATRGKPIFKKNFDKVLHIS